MDAIRSWAVSICLGAVAAALARILVPNGALQKVFRVFIAVFFLSCFLSPFLQNGNGLHFEIPSLEANMSVTSGALQEEVDRQLKTQIERRLSELCEQAINKVGITPQKITIDMDTGEDGSISIKQVAVVLKQEDRMQEAAVSSAINEALGFIPQIGYDTEVKRN